VTAHARWEPGVPGATRTQRGPLELGSLLQIGLTSCLQSQIGRDRHLQRGDAAHVDAASALSVVVRSGPVETAVNGTPVARPPRMTPESACALLRPDPTVRPVFGDHRLVGKSPEGSRQPDGGLELRKVGLRTVWVEP
jgi:hypothetical protein